MTEPDRIGAALEAHEQTVRRFFQRHGADIPRVAKVLAGALAGGAKVLLFGNGGSAADAQHLAAELVNRMVRDRPALAALALTTDTSVLSSIANDAAYDQVFARQIEGLGRPGDVAFAFSTSGNSPNILRALATARKGDLITVSLLGHDGGKALALSDHALVVDSDITARIQETHILVGHLLCEEVERLVCPPPRSQAS